MKIVNTMRNKLLILFLLVSALPILFNWFILIAVQSENHLHMAELFMKDQLRSGLDLVEAQTMASADRPSVQETLESLEGLLWVKKAGLRPLDGGGPKVSVNGEHGVIYLELDQDRLIRNLDMTNETVEIVEAGDNPSETLERIRQQDDSQLIIGEELFDGDLLAVGRMPKEIILEKDIFWSGLLIRSSLIMMIVAVSISYIISYRYTQGMEMLAGDIRRIREGDFRDTVTIKGNDEIADLSYAFHKMAEEMDQLVNRTLRLTISERNAKIRAMQSQISPHFLYNALDSVNWNLLKKGDFESSQILVSLSGILRYSIDDSKDTVTVREEFEQMENYLTVQQSRFFDRFTYQVDLEESIADEQVPKMILQPLVENAVSHGLENEKGGLLKIQGVLARGGLEIRVWDNGKGIGAEALERLQKKMNENGQIADEQDFHLGIANVHNRLRYRYGENSGLFIESVEGSHTLVTVRICTE